MKSWLSKLTILLVACLTLAGTACEQHSEVKPSPSPSSKIALAYCDDSGNISLVGGDGTHLKQLTSNLTAPDSVLPLSPLWSPDGNLLAFWGYSDNRWNIYISEVNSQRLVNVTKDKVAMGEWLPGTLFGWSTDSEEVFFVAGEGIYKASMDSAPEMLIPGADILVFNDDRTKATLRCFVELDENCGDTLAITKLDQITLERPQNVGADWQPTLLAASAFWLRGSSTKLYFMVDDGLYSVNRDGSEQILVADGLDPLHNGWITPSPDGLFVAYLAWSISANGTTSLNSYVSRFDGSERVVLEEVVIDADADERRERALVGLHGFGWSKNGRFLAFRDVHLRNESDVDIFTSVYDLETKNIIPHRDGVNPSGALSWSEGGTLAFSNSSSQFSIFGARFCSVLLWDVATNQSKSLGELPDGVLPMTLLWSPDGNNIAVIAVRVWSTYPDLYMANVRDREITKVSAVLNDWAVAWRPLSQ